MKSFIERWKNRGDEKSDTQKFWIDFLSEVCGVDNPTEIIEFEKRVVLAHKSFIDGYIPSTRVIIEQKSLDVKLDNAAKQSDGSLMTPFEQAKRYSDWLPDSERARWIITCNFQEFRIYDMERPKADPEIIRLENLEKERRKFLFMVDLNASSPKDIHEEEISVKAGELARKLRDSLEKRYKNPGSREAQQSLTVICVRIVFLLYAEDTELSGGGRKFQKGSFHDYMLKHKDSSRTALINLFAVLSQKVEERDPYLDSDLADFPYVNGGLFDETNIEIPQIDGEPLEIILREMSEGFDWSGINPTIFGAIFESVLDGGGEKEKSVRREGGMHYTSIENIHKVIDPLFLENLKSELDKILKSKSTKRTKNLIEFQESLGKLKFLDPACGSGNFLTETYLSLRRLENQILSELTKQQINFATGDLSPIKVRISQFFGIEINGFAVAVAKTALWIAEAQMWNETKNIIQNLDDFLPLENYGNIIEANALKIDWREVVKPEELNFIMGNPPFIGHQWRTAQQNEDMKTAFHDLKEHGKLDYVCSWYNKAVDFMKGTGIKSAFVSTNSICQGESVGILWKFLKEKGIEISFAYRSFIWSSEAKDKAHVHCVIVGFSLNVSENKKIFDGEKIIAAKNINGYLLDAPDIFMNNRGKPLNKNMPSMKKGSQPTDDGNLILSSQERQEILNKYPEAEKFIKRYVGAREFIHNEIRFCLWLYGVDPKEYRHITPIRERLKKVADFRMTSPTKSVQAAADTPGLFTQIRQPTGNFLCVPRVTSEGRKYIPIGFMKPDVIVSDRVSYIPDADLYMFGILSSALHMAWVDVVAGRLEMRYNYSPFVYNNFPFPTFGHGVQKLISKIESTAQKILEAREKFPESSLADLYDPLTMPEELLQAHKANDAAVCEAYGFDKNISEEEIVSTLMNTYDSIFHNIS